MNKKILPAYHPPKLVKGSSKYYIEVIAKSKITSKLRRFRPTFGINRIVNLQNRAKRGREIVELIAFWLKSGKYFEDFDELKAILLRQEKDKVKAKKKISMSLLDAMDLALKVRLNRTNKRATQRTLHSHLRLFTIYLKEKGKSKMKLHQFTAREAFHYSDYWITDLGITNGNTFNNRLICIKGFFNVLVDREYILVNPFKKVKPQKIFKSGKDNFTLGEMPLILEGALEQNKWLWMAMQLAFWGTIRQEELARLRFKHFDAKKWCIHMDGEMTKNGKMDVITLPMGLRAKFLELGFFEQPINRLVFGKKLEPGNEIINEHTLYRRHKKLLTRMYAEEKVERRKGLSFCSWRRTGMEYIANKIPPRKAQQHFRHEDWSTTEKYMPNRKFLAEVSALECPF